MISSIVRKTAWKLWDDTKQGFIIIGFLTVVIGGALMAAGTIASFMITILDYFHLDAWPRATVHQAHMMCIMGSVFWFGVWVACRVRQSIRELRR